MSAAGKTPTEALREARARALRGDAEGLTNDELLALVLDDEAADPATVLGVAKDFLTREGLCALSAYTAKGLAPSFGSSRGARVAAAFELADRVRARYAGATDPSQSGGAPANDNARAR